MSWIEETLHKFIDKKVLIVGDVMIDRYLTGHVSRISPEAPVPIVNLDNIENRLGGAANVALNINALKATPIIASIVGNDENGKLFKKVLSGNNLGQLANVHELPHIDPAFNDDKLKNIIQYYSINPDDMEKELHQYAKQLLDKGKVTEAWQVLLSSV